MEMKIDIGTPIIKLLERDKEKLIKLIECIDTLIAEISNPTTESSTETKPC